MEPTLYGGITPAGLIDEFIGLADWAALAKHLNCSVFELLGRPDCTEWMDVWQRSQAVLAEMSEVEHGR